MDTEFDDNGRTIELISIALVAEDGRHYYAVSDEFDPAKCCDWVKANVLPKLPMREGASISHWKSRAQIAYDVLRLMTEDGNPELWGYFCAYDFVALCQLYGPMVDLPREFRQQRCQDLSQHMTAFGFSPSMFPPPANAHDALSDAEWVRDTYLKIERLRNGGTGQVAPAGGRKPATWG